MKLLIAATNLRTGQGRVFQEHELTVECVLASAALPQLHRSVEIAGDVLDDSADIRNELDGLARSRRKADAEAAADEKLAALKRRMGQ